MARSFRNTESVAVAESNRNADSANNAGNLSVGIASGLHRPHRFTIESFRFAKERCPPRPAQAA